MLRLIVLAALGLLIYWAIVGRWPWEAKTSARGRAVIRARRLLGVQAQASRDDILAAHKRLVALIHPDRGGSSQQVHEANAARDLLLDQLPGRGAITQEPQ